MAKKKILISAKKQHDIIKGVIGKLKEVKDIEFVFHDPTENFLDLQNIAELFKDVDFLIVKVRSECSIDLLHYAKLHNIPALHDIDTVMTCTNKVALDHALRKIFNNNPSLSDKFILPKSWTQSLRDVKKFKKWAKPRLPIVIKSHYQHDKYMRFNFLVKKLEEVDLFCKRYEHFLYYDVYIQEFIECDGIDRKIYVVGDKIFGIKRENPIYIYLRVNPEDIDVDVIEREDYEISDDIRRLAKVLSKGLNLKIFGFDLIKSINQNKYHVVDLNDFPGFRGIGNIETVLANFLIENIKNIK
jgi:glutathione synthase/RimK-type ligase-like ATP-grasp enzyme